MAGQLQSAIVEIGKVYDLFVSLRKMNPNLAPECVIECLGKFFGNDRRIRSIFAKARSSDKPQIKILKNLQEIYESYQKLTILCPNSAPDTLIETLGAILTPLNLKVEKRNEPPQAPTSFVQQDNARDDESDSSIEILHVKGVQNRNSKSNKDDDKNNDDEDWEDNDSSPNLDGPFARHEEVVREPLPSTSTSTFSSLHKQSRRRVKNWVDKHSTPSPIPSPGFTVSDSSDQDESNSDDVMEVSSQNTSTANSEKIQEPADEIGSNGASSSFIRVSSRSNKNDSRIPATPENETDNECSYGCGKTYVTKAGRLLHEKIHSGIGLFNCDFCDRQFTTRQPCENHQKAHHKQQTPARNNDISKKRSSKNVEGSSTQTRTRTAPKRRPGRPRKFYTES